MDSFTFAPVDVIEEEIEKEEVQRVFSAHGTEGERFDGGIVSVPVVAFARRGQARYFGSFRNAGSASVRRIQSLIVRHGDYGESVLGFGLR